ncbi:MAG: hypothetical protein WC241_03290 [Candidatus Paceibacterota bacterium]|jgi:hypothetical protein
MMEDLKTVVITFGLVALVFLQGSLMYQKKIHNEYILAVKQEQSQKTKISKITTSQNTVQAQLNKPQPTQALAQVPVQIQTPTQVTTTPASRQSRAS